MGNQYCFVCGADNPRGLHVHFEKRDRANSFATFYVDKEMAGWPSVQHGGITSTLLDEACAYVATFLGKVTVTAELNISFKAPIRVGETLYIEATPTRESRKLILVQATIHNAEGELKATADAKMMVLSKDQLEELGLSENILNEVSTPAQSQ
ncbi:PaaI family thioesterase [Alicyclobacillus tolerans]|uniref:Acyl-coenzyme A thioesterase THEM4 n=1 Tax=Alicyclobacillus tolerans TaxID=90970 RepID=A0ABT9LXP0_9BACL|nr:PaaI family thioesterase [Alicyclobacillus tengchongensis]MDP9729033.1 uncharacterized protein (TIGR00369 family) [Alicyclobacillus tengchongensis]